MHLFQSCCIVFIYFANCATNCKVQSDKGPEEILLQKLHVLRNCSKSLLQWPVYLNALILMEGTILHFGRQERMGNRSPYVLGQDKTVLGIWCQCCCLQQPYVTSCTSICGEFGSTVFVQNFLFGMCVIQSSRLHSISQRQLDTQVRSNSFVRMGVACKSHLLPNMTWKWTCPWLHPSWHVLAATALNWRLRLSMLIHSAFNGFHLECELRVANSEVQIKGCMFWATSWSLR